MFRFWHDLVNRHEVKGKNAHDARIVAAMLRHGISHLLTFNAADFIRFAAIQVWTPSDIITGKYDS